MRVIDPGHRYALTIYQSNAEGLLEPVFDATNPVNDQRVTFISKLAGKDVYPGTTNEEVLLMMIDRMKFLDTKFPCAENKEAITNLEAALKVLEKRTTNRKEQGVEGKNKPHVS